MTETGDMTKILCRTLLNCKTEEDCLALLSDLCTFQEQEQMAQRAAAAKLLLEGKTYAEIMDSTEILRRRSPAFPARCATAAAAMRG